MFPPFLIDASGEPWRGDTQQLAASVGLTDRGSDGLLKSAVNCFGYVRIVPLTSTGAAIIFSRSAVLPVALVGAITWLADSQPRRVVLSNVAAPAPVPEILSCRHAIDALGKICDERISAPRFQRRNVSISSSHFATRSDAAQEILNAGLDLDTQSHILDKLFQRHFVLADRDASSGHFLLADAGLEVDRYMDDFGPLQIGRPFTVLEDAQFGQWIANGLREFRPADKPVAEVIEVRTQSPKTGRNYLRYTRLVVPFARDGRDRVMTAAVIESG